MCIGDRCTGGSGEAEGRGRAAMAGCGCGCGYLAYGGGVEDVDHVVVLELTDHDRVRCGAGGDDGRGSHDLT